LAQALSSERRHVFIRAWHSGKHLQETNLLAALGVFCALRESVAKAAVASNALHEVVGKRSQIERLAVPPTVDLLTVQQVAAALKVNQATVRTWINSGALRASRPGIANKPGRIFRVSRSDLDAFVAGANKPGPKREVDIKAEAARIVASLSRNRGR
jgi:excisionase family DNA binding protein